MTFLFTKKQNNNSGFTLIELLVVISIVSLLTSIVLSSLSSARIKARDAKRIQDLRQIVLALELYRNDKGYYPYDPTLPTPDNWRVSTDSNRWNGSGWLKTALIDGGYISILPIDPLNKGGDLPRTPGENDYSYAYLSGYANCDKGKCYDLYVKLENKNSPYRCAVRQQKNKYDDNVECNSSSPVNSPYLYSPEH
jgi:prepilin-type N-terminal cleavage/methylation domain-containing protein